MECRPLEITLISANDLKDVNFFSKMDVYAVVSVKGDPHYTTQKQKTHVDKDCGPNPRWDHTMKFTLDEESLQRNRLSLNFQLFSDRSMGDKEIGEVHVPIKELLDQHNRNSSSSFDGKIPAQQNIVNYSVRIQSGKSKGSLNFSFKFGDKMPAPAAVGKDKLRYAEPVMAYPPAGSSAQAPLYGGYPPQQPHHYPYPPPGGYAPPPPQPVYGGYPPQPGYGYPQQQGYPPQPGYAYPQQQGYPPQPGYSGGYAQQPQKPKKGNGGKMALGVGAGLLGGLLIGDMISDVGDAAAYDAGFDDGFGF